MLSSYIFIYFLTGGFLVKCEQFFATGPDRFEEPRHQPHSVLIAFLARNQQATLPWFLGCLDKLDYPKDRIGLWVATDHNVDNTSAILHEWLAAVSGKYNSIYLKEGERHMRRFDDESGPREWTEHRMDHVIKLRQAAMDYARKVWADYIFFVDSDVYITETNTLKILMAQKKTIIGGLLKTTTTYSNFWSGMTSKGFYERTEDYLPIVNRENLGTHPVPMVHTNILINLRHRDSLRLNYHPAVSTILNTPDDIIQLALAARLAGVQMYVCNTVIFGYVMPPPGAEESLDEDESKQIYTRLTAMNDGHFLYPSEHVNVVRSEPTLLGYDQVYMINLDRRPERRQKMFHSFDELRIKFKYWPAVDGKNLNDSYLQAHNVKMLDSYLDPYHKRPLKAGEIGCFLSHYFIWKDVVAHGYEKVLVFEDDIRFKVFFREKMSLMQTDIQEHNLTDWDLIYIGRKILRNDEQFAGVRTLVYPMYTYWTLSYALTLKGAKKLLAPDPVSKMVPVDEYLPIMYDAHPQETWKKAFPVRNLNALSINPLAVEPTIYYGDTNYISDTEASPLVNSVTPSPAPENKQQMSNLDPTSGRLPDEL